jgi:hypothetical protein
MFKMPCKMYLIGGEKLKGKKKEVHGSCRELPLKIK